MRRTFEQIVSVAAPVTTFLLFVFLPLPLCQTIQPQYSGTQRSMMIDTPAMSCVNLTEQPYLGEY